MENLSRLLKMACLIRDVMITIIINSLVTPSILCPAATRRTSADSPARRLLMEERECRQHPSKNFPFFMSGAVALAPPVADNELIVSDKAHLPMLICGEAKFSFA